MVFAIHPAVAVASVLAVGAVLPDFINGMLCDPRSQACQDRDLRNNLSEKQIDRMLRDSFPASDPPSTY